MKKKCRLSPEFIDNIAGISIIFVLFLAIIGFVFAVMFSIGYVAVEWAGMRDVAGDYVGAGFSVVFGSIALGLLVVGLIGVWFTVADMKIKNNMFICKEDEDE